MQTDVPMKVLTVKRTHYLSEMTLGTIDFENRPFAQTLEKPWKDNKPFISCIPEGEYLCKRIISPKFGDTFQIMDVLNRSFVLIHFGNIPEDTEGCLIIGESFGKVKGEYGVISSRTVVGQGFLEFKDLTHGLDIFRLVILNKA